MAEPPASVSTKSPKGDPSPSPPPTQTPTLDQLIGAFNTLRELIKSTPVTSDVAIRFRSAVQESDVAKFCSELQKFRGYDKLLSFKPPVRYNEVEAGLKRILLLHNNGDKTLFNEKAANKHISKIASIACIAPHPVACVDLEKRLPTLPGYIWKALTVFSNRVEWATEDGSPNPMWPDMWRGGKFPTYSQRKVHLYNELRGTHDNKVDRLPQASDFFFYSYKFGGSAVYRSVIDTKASTPRDIKLIETDTKTDDLDPLRRIGLIKVKSHAPETDVRTKNAVYLAMLSPVDTPDDVPLQVYVGKAANGTYNRWCLDSDCHLDKIQEIIKAAQSNADPPNKMLLVDLELAALWVLNPRRWETVCVVSIKSVTTETLEADESASITDYAAKNQRLGMNGTN